MKVVILAGGFGTRISEMSYLLPKPMIEIGERPILWHIMKSYYHYGYSDFIICCGYKSQVIKEYFSNYYLYNSDITFDFCSGNSIDIHANSAEKWRVTLVETGLNTMTGGRVKRIEQYVKDEPFMLTYGDGVSDIDIDALLRFHRSHGNIATLSAVRPSGRFGLLDIKNSAVTSFREKNRQDTGLVNAGYMVFQPEIFQYLENDDTILERYPLETLAHQGQLMAYEHGGFWQCMDTQRDKQTLDELWESGRAPWRTW